MSSHSSVLYTKAVNFFSFFKYFSPVLIQEAALEEMKKELQARPTTKLVDDLRKKVKILQVMPYFLYFLDFSLMLLREIQNT